MIDLRGTAQKQQVPSRMCCTTELLTRGILYTLIEDSTAHVLVHLSCLVVTSSVAKKRSAIPGSPSNNWSQIQTIHCLRSLEHREIRVPLSQSNQDKAETPTALNDNHKESV